MWHLFTQKKIKHNYTRKHFSNFVEYKLPGYCFKNFYINNYNKKIYLLLSDHSNNEIITPNKYGAEIGFSYYTNYYNSILQKYFDVRSVNRTFLSYAKIGGMVYFVQNTLNNIKIAVASGVFAVVYKQMPNIKQTKIKLPSGQFKFLSSECDVYLGRNGDVYKQYSVWGSWGFKFANKKHRPIVRGVAMNPVDHPNGGRSKVKKPFRNKYNKIAKKGK